MARVDVLPFALFSFHIRALKKLVKSTFKSQFLIAQSCQNVKNTWVGLKFRFAKLKACSTRETISVREGRVSIDFSAFRERYPLICQAEARK